MQNDDDKVGLAASRRRLTACQAAPGAAMGRTAESKGLTVSAPEDDQIKPWTIKNVPPDVRHAAIAAAARVNSAIGEYVTQALREKIKRDREAGRQKPETFDPIQNLAAIERMVALAMQISQMNRSEPPPASLTKAIYGLIGRRVRAIREMGHVKMLTGPASEPEASEATVDQD